MYNGNFSETSNLDNFVIFQYFSMKFGMYIPFIVLDFFVSLCSYQIWVVKKLCGKNPFFHIFPTFRGP